jgi:hypothetical protein
MYSETLSVYNYKQITLKETHQLEVLFDVAFDSSNRACLSRSYTITSLRHLSRACVN